MIPTARFSGLSGCTKVADDSSNISRIDGKSDAIIGRLEAMYSNNFKGDVCSTDNWFSALLGMTRASAAFKYLGISEWGWNSITETLLETPHSDILILVYHFV